jgi:hypothetical protein
VKIVKLPTLDEMMDYEDLPQMQSLTPEPDDMDGTMDQQSIMFSGTNTTKCFKISHVSDQN